jgi:hypothetical protein
MRMGRGHRCETRFHLTAEIHGILLQSGNINTVPTLCYGRGFKRWGSYRSRDDLSKPHPGIEKRSEDITRTTRDRFSIPGCGLDRPSRSSSEQTMISRILTWSQTCSTVFALLPHFIENLSICVCAHTFKFYAIGELLAVRVHRCVGPVGCTWCSRGVVECCADRQRMVSRFLLLPSNGQNKEQLQRVLTIPLEIPPYRGHDMLRDWSRLADCRAFAAVWRTRLKRDSTRAYILGFSSRRRRKRSDRVMRDQL